MKIIIINGPNLNRIRSRNLDYYGKFSLEQISDILHHKFNEIEFDIIQSDIEGELVGFILDAPKNYSGLIINPGGFSHSSISIRDALEICNIPKIEVHLSNLSDREHFRNVSLTASKCNGYISGFKYLSYVAAVNIVLDLINLKNQIPIENT